MTPAEIAEMEREYTGDFGSWPEQLDVQKLLAHIAVQGEQLRQALALLLALRDGVDKYCPGGIPCGAETWDAIDTVLSSTPVPPKEDTHDTR